MKLKTCSLKEAILWGGAASLQLSVQNGATLELLEPLRCVIATHADAKRPVKMIPLENVKDFEPLTEAAEKALAAKSEELAAQIAAAKQREVAKKMSAKSVMKRGATKFVKDPVTGEVVETEV